MRLSETFSLHVDNIYLDHQLIRLTKTKNGHERDVALSDACIQALADQLNRSTDGYLWHWFPERLAQQSHTLSEEEARQNAQDQTSSRLSKLWKGLFKQCGAPDDFTFHYLRHEAASRVFEGTNMPDRMIMKHFGWSSWKMVDNYSHLRPSTTANYLNSARR